MRITKTILFILFSFNTLAKGKWVLIMDSHFAKENIVHIRDSITDVHNIHFIKQKGVYILLEGNDSLALENFHRNVLLKTSLFDFPYSTFGWLGAYEENLFENDFDDTIRHAGKNYEKLFSINARWISYVNTVTVKYCHWQFRTNAGHIEGNFTQYGRDRKIVKTVSYKAGKKNGLSITFRKNGDTICVSDFKENIKLSGRCYDSGAKYPFLNFSLDKRLLNLRAMFNGEIVFSEYQLDSAGMMNGSYTKRNAQGIILETGTLKNGRADGEVKSYNHDGTLMKIEKWENDEIVK